MRVYAESQPAKTVPYLHLGYLAAAPPQSATGGLMLWGGVVLVVLGTLLVAKAFVARSARTVLYATVWPRRRRAGVLGLAALLIGAFSLYAGLGFKKDAASRMASVTKMRMRMLEMEVGFLLAERDRESPPLLLKEGESDLKAFLLTLPDFTPQQGYLTNFAKDAEGRPMRVQVSKQTNTWRWTFIAAGPDGRFGTADDIRQTKENVGSAQ